MIDRITRARLSVALRRLVEGEISNDDFAGIAARLPTQDLAVSEIAQFGCSLFHDLYPYRLTGAHRPSPDVARLAERCWLFLDTDLEYEWPPYPTGATFHWLLLGCGAVAILGGLMAHFAFSWQRITLAAIGLCMLFVTWAVKVAVEPGRIRRFWMAGPREVWPFFLMQSTKRRPDHPRLDDRAGARIW